MGLRRGEGDVAGASPAFRGFSGRLVTVSFQTVIWGRHGTPLSLPTEATGAFQLHVVLETAASRQLCSASPACGTSSWSEQELGHMFLLSESF